MLSRRDSKKPPHQRHILINRCRDFLSIISKFHTRRATGIVKNDIHFQAGSALSLISPLRSESDSSRPALPPPRYHDLVTVEILCIFVDIDDRFNDNTYVASYFLWWLLDGDTIIRRRSPIAHCLDGLIGWSLQRRRMLSHRVVISFQRCLSLTIHISIRGLAGFAFLNTAVTLIISPHFWPRRHFITTRYPGHKAISRCQRNGVARHSRPFIRRPRMLLPPFSGHYTAKIKMGD